jgi:hypothetical protein
VYLVFLSDSLWSSRHPQNTNRVEMNYEECIHVSALSAGAYTATLYAMVNTVE